MQRNYKDLFMCQFAVSRKVRLKILLQLQPKRTAHTSSKPGSSSRLKWIPLTDIQGESKKLFYVDEGNKSDNVLVFLGGTAQTASTFTPHIRAFSNNRRLIIPELRGQGLTDLDAAYGNMKQQVEDLEAAFETLDIKQVDMCGFSFGGRVALAFAAHRPDLVRRLSISGVPLQRPALGRFILESWIDGLSRHNFRECAHSFIINGYSASFIAANYERLRTYVDLIIVNNDESKLLALLNSNHAVHQIEQEYSAFCCSKRIRCPTQLISFKQDRLAGWMEVHDLASAMRDNGVSVNVETMDTGHLGLYEKPMVWREAVLSFFSHQ